MDIRSADDKYPTHDFIVELVDRPEYFFFVQVKATTKGYTKTSPGRLLVQVSQEDVDRMVACPAPTYVVGIDLVEGAGYLLSVNETREHVASMATTHKIDCGVLATWTAEIHDYWATRDMVLADSVFKE